jgi:class 3 adenylate cyclase
VGAVEVVADDVRGIAVHVAARICEQASPGQILVSSTVRDILIDSEVPLELVSEQELRGVPGTWTLYAMAAVAGEDEHPHRVTKPAADYR